MAIISFVDDASYMADAFISKNYNKIDAKIMKEQGDLSFCKVVGDRVAGYNITTNQALTSLYNMNVYVVKFVLSNIDTCHNLEQYNLLESVFFDLREHMQRLGGYFVLRVPSHIVDLIKLFNQVFPSNIFCGGTVQQVVYGGEVECLKIDGASVNFKDVDYIRLHNDELLKIAFSSFANYQSQYHISNITEPLAGSIYSNWLKSSTMSDENNIVVVEYKSEPAGFATIDETNQSVEVLLTAVDEKYRGKRLYRMMIEFLINYAQQKNKKFIISTQFDNFIVQGVWASLGLVPFYSIYNFHIDI